MVERQSVYCAGLPAEPLITQRWRDMIANHSPINNPAILTEENYLSLRLALAPILNGEFLHSEVGLTLPLGLYQSVGLTYVGEDDGSIFGSKLSDVGEIILDQSKKSSSGHHLFMLSYAYHIWNRLSIGINLDYAMQTQYGDPVMGVGADLGLTYRALRHPIFGDHIIGLSTQNLIAPQMSKILSFSGSVSEYARNLRFTWFSRFLEDQLESTLDVNFKDFLASASAFTQKDTSYAKQIEFDVNYKIGVWLLRLFRLYLQTGIGQDGMDYLGMALGINIPSINNGRDFEVFYQYNVMTQAENDATGHSIYARIDMGRHREEIFARKMARLVSLSPNDLYNRARKLYSEKKYWDAFFMFSRLYTEYPDFFKIDWVQYYRASCEELLDMRDAAVKNYEKMKKDYPTSSAVPYSDLGLMRVHYRNGNFGYVASQYMELTKPNTPDSLRFHGDYLMGQTFLQQRDFNRAIEDLSKIPDGHPDYVFAQHAIAICQVSLNLDLSTVVATLENCVGTKVLTDAEKEIVNRSYLFLGYIFYEENALSKAVVSLRMVPTTSIYAEDALLGQGWTSLKARQWSDCVAAGHMLYRSTNQEALKCEGMLIESYGHLLQKDYFSALDLLKNAAERIRNVRTPDRDSLNFVSMKNESERMGYNNLAERVEYEADLGQSSVIINQIDSLYSKQTEYLKKFKDYYNFADNFSRTTFFSRNVDTIREDIDYALATVQKIVGQKGLQKEKEKLDDKQRQIDSEIDKLKNEMEKIQSK